MKRFEDMFTRLAICWDVCDLISPVVAGDAQHGVPNGDLMRMCDRAPSPRACPVNLMKSASMSKTYRNTYSHTSGGLLLNSITL